MYKMTQFLIFYNYEKCKHTMYIYFFRLFFTDLSLLIDGITGVVPYVKVVDNFDAEYEVVYLRVVCNPLFEFIR